MEWLRFYHLWPRYTGAGTIQRKIKLLNSIKDYALGIGLFILLILSGLVKYLFSRNRELERTNSIHDKIQDIHAEQEIEKHKIMEREDQIITEKVDDIKKSKKSKRDRINSI